MLEDEYLKEALTYVSSDDYETWVKVGMALKTSGYPLDVWEEWSRGSPKYKPGVCDRKWKSFHRDDLTTGTIIQMARDAGMPVSSSTDNSPLRWDEVIDEAPDKGYKIIDADLVKGQKLPAPSLPEKDMWQDLRRYIDLLFKPDEFVCYCDKLVEKDGRTVPLKSIKRRTKREIADALSRGGLAAASIDPGPLGAWIRINPMDGEGEEDANVTEFRHILIENDKDSIEKQYALLQEMRLPITCLVHSGNKSLHAIVKVNAGIDGRLYKERRDFVLAFCEKNGFHVDKAAKNSSRYSRMPGVKRGDNWQYIIATNIGFPSYEEWKEWADAQNDALPVEVSLDEVWDNMPPLKEELIEGILRMGHKCLLSGPSKAGKSFALMELAVCIGNGLPWLGHKCHKGKVLYVNLEVDEASCLDRFKNIMQRHGLSKEAATNIKIWNLRGRQSPMDKLTPLAINRYKGKGFAAIIIDPIYKVITGDENNASDMGRFCGYFDRLGQELEASPIYCHHDSKGAAMKYSNTMDRSSGSGVFARDPDAILSFTQLNVISEAVTNYKDHVPDACDVVTAWEMNATLREFAPMPPTRLWFDYPVHKVDEWDLLADAKYSGTGRAAFEDRRPHGVGKKQKTPEEWQEAMAELFEMATFGEGEALSQDYVLSELDISERTLKRLAAKNSGYQLITLETGDKVIAERQYEEILFKGVIYKKRAKVWIAS